MQVHAKLKNIRVAPRKARLIIDVVRGMAVSDAENTLRFMNKKGAKMVWQLVQSAAANATHNYKLAKESLKIASITANEGIVIKRHRARAFGRAAMIRKRTSHVHVILEGELAQAKKKVKISARDNNKPAASIKKNLKHQPQAVKPAKPSGPDAVATSSPVESVKKNQRN